MIKINFSSAISIYLCFSIFLVFVLWVFYNYYRNGILNETKYLQQCPYCTYVFFDYKSKDLKIENTGEIIKDSKVLKPDNEHSAESAHLGDKANKVLICPRCQSYINL